MAPTGSSGRPPPVSQSSPFGCLRISTSPRMLDMTRTEVPVDGLTPMHLLLVLGIAILVLGPKRLPEAGEALGSPSPRSRRHRTPRLPSPRSHRHRPSPWIPQPATGRPAPDATAASTPPSPLHRTDPVSTLAASTVSQPRPHAGGRWVERRGRPASADGTAVTRGRFERPPARAGRRGRRGKSAVMRDGASHVRRAVGAG
jgi:hypothetical protein